MNAYSTTMRFALWLSFFLIALMKPSLAEDPRPMGVLDKKITVVMSNRDLKSVLGKIEQAATVKFAYTSQTIPLSTRVSVSAKYERLGDVLSELLAPYRVTYEVVGSQIIIQKGKENAAGFKKITGTVRSAAGTPLAGVTVSIKGQPRGAVTNSAGYFELEADEGAILVFTAIGFMNQELSVGSSGNYDVVMEGSTKELSEVVVTALGVRKERRSLGFSITEVKGAELAATNEVNPINALQGKAAGVSIDQGSGGLFGNSRILIRGNSTLSTNNQPIFVIDGVIIDNEAFNDQGRDFGNALKNLNMEDFESVSILKGSAAAALYGARSINGVVLITTKKGRANRGIGVTVSQTFNIQQPYRGPDFQNEFGGGTVGAFFTDTRDPGYNSNQSWETKVFPVNANGDPYIDPQKNRELENWGPRFAN